jgi:chaperonin GroEL
LAYNGGYESSAVVSKIKQAEPECGFDVRTGQMVNMWDAGIVDSLPVIERALQTAASVAGMAVTTTAVVHKRKSYPGTGVP